MCTARGQVKKINNGPSSYCGFNPWVGKIPWSRKMATHSSILAWKIPWAKQPGGLQSRGCQRVGHDWAHTHTSSYKALPQQNDPSLTLWGQLWFTNKTGIFFFFFFLLFLWHIQWTIVIFIKVLAFSVTQLPNAVLLSYYFILHDFLVCKKELFKSFCQGWAQLDNQSLGNCT